MDLVYLNNASTTQLSQSAIKDFTYAAKKYWANPSDVSNMGLSSKKIIEDAQKQIAKSINAEKPSGIVFTSGGSESNNWAIKGYVDRNNVELVITTAIEHPSVYNIGNFLIDHGVAVINVPTDEDGIVNVETLKRMLQNYTACGTNGKNILVSIMFANNEIGTIQPIKEIAEIVHKYNAVLHVDAVQAYMHTPIDVQEMCIDLMSTSFHKIGGFKNCGFLYIKDGIKLTPLIHGGHQFDSQRSGTENVPMIYAMGNLVEKISPLVYEYKNRMDALWHYTVDKILQHKDSNNYEILLNGSSIVRMKNNLNLTFKGINAEMLIALLELEGIYVSAGSACCSGEKTPSRVLKAIGLSDEDAFSTIRVSFGVETDFNQIDYFVEKLFEVLNGMKMIKEFGDEDGE